MLQLSDTVAWNLERLQLRLFALTTAKYLRKSSCFQISSLEAIGKWYKSRSQNCTSAFNEYGVSKGTFVCTYRYIGSFQVSCETQKKRNTCLRRYFKHFKSAVLQLLHITSSTATSATEHGVLLRIFGSVIYPRRHLKFALYWTTTCNTIRFDVEVKLWSIKPEYAKVLCWRLLRLRILYVKVVVTHGNNKKLLYLGYFSIYLVKILATGKQVSNLLHHNVWWIYVLN